MLGKEHQTEPGTLKGARQSSFVPEALVPAAGRGHRKKTKKTIERREPGGHAAATAPIRLLDKWTPRSKPDNNFPKIQKNLGPGR
jgi:hypothetical protein